MTDQQLARALILGNKLSPQNAQSAAQKRTAEASFARLLVEMGFCSTMDILQVDPDAFNDNNPSPHDDTPRVQSQMPGTNNHANGHANNHAVVTIPDALPEVPEDVGIGQGERPDFDNSGVIINDHETDARDSEMGPIVLYVNELLKIAAQIGASDMHLEPRGRGVGLLPRYRVDGLLRPGAPIPIEMQPAVISRLKVLANLDITENRLPQDGRFRAVIGGRTYDLRVSSLPSMHGEKLVLRLLDRTSLVTDLSKLGFSTEDRNTLSGMLARAQGMLLVTGPTGSGKTTTLYAALASARDETRNVVTVEDPIEYELAGVTQTGVQSEIGLTFAAQLRAILRQDPDVILVGEVRDTETADMAVRAALTGHLVLSTLHTNSAVAAIARLQDMEIPPFLIASSLTGVLAQRLVRLICRQCRQQMDQNSEQYQASIASLNLPPGSPLFHGAGCEACGGTGMKGRMALIELLNVDAAMRARIMARDDADTLRRLAIEHGMKTLWQDGLDKLRRGLTTADEISRVLLGQQESVEG